MSNLSRKPLLIVSDVDKTLTAKNTWYELTRHLNGDLEIHFSLYNQYKKGQISHDAMSKGLIEMLSQSHGRPITRQEIEEVFFQVDLKGEAIAIFNDLKQRGYTLAVISSSIDVFVKQIAKRLNIDHWNANSVFEFNERDEWINFQYTRDEAALKLQQLNHLLATLDIDRDRVLVIGDSAGDRELFKHFPGVAVDNEDASLSDLAWKEIKYLPTLIQLLEELPD